MVAGDEIVHVSRRVFVELLVVAKDEDGDVDRAKYGELMSLLEETAFTLQKRAAGQTCWLATGAEGVALGAEGRGGERTLSGCGHL